MPCIPRTTCAGLVLLLTLFALNWRVAAADDVPVLVSAEPVAVLQLASINRLLDDVDYLLDAGSVPQYGQLVRGFVAALNGLEGIDRDRPLGAMLFLDPAQPDAEPRPLIYLPLTDVVPLRATIMATGNALEPTASPGLFTLRLGSDHLHLLAADGYGFIVDPDKAPPSFRTEALARLIAAEQSQLDATLTFRREGVPASRLERAIATLTEQAARELARRTNESDADHAVRSNLEGSVYELLGLVLSEGRALSAGVDFGRGHPLAVGLELRTDPQSELRTWTQQTLVAPSLLPAGDALASALHWSSAVDLSPRGRDVGRQALSLGRERMQRELGAQAPDVVRRQVDGAFAALDETVAKGRLETRIEFLPTPSGRFVLLAGAAVRQAESVDEAARTLLPLAAQAGDLQRVQLDAFRAGGLPFHRIEGKGVRERDRRLYGANLALYLAAGDEAVWLAVGGDETAQVIDRALASGDSPEGRQDSGQLHVRLRPWIDFALREGVAGDRRAAELASQLLTQEATITASIAPGERGLRAAVVVDEAYVQLLARLAVLKVKGEAR